VVFATPTLSQRGRRIRRGGVSPFVVVAIGVFVAALALAVDSATMWHARVEIRNAADAADLAAVQELVNDGLFSNRAYVMAGIVERARAQAIAFGQANPVLGQPLELDLNIAHEPQGDIVFGYMETPHADFLPATDLTDVHINAVRIIARRTRERGNPAGMLIARFFHMDAADVVATATAVLDRDVIGFRPNGNKPLPIAPLGILSDPTFANEDAWESQVVMPLLTPDGGGVDQFVFDRHQRNFLAVGDQVTVGDGIPEMHVHIPLTDQPTVSEDEPNGCLLQIGDANWDILCRQFTLGVTKQDLSELDGQFSLAWDNRLYLPGHLQAPGINDAHLGTLLNALKTLQLTGESRIWPLYGTVQRNHPNGEGVAVIQGFVAARLVSADLDAVGEGTEKDPKRQELKLILQPCMISTGTALTDASRRHANPAVDIHNPYICKVRLVE
jgi:putative Flp pilus-assembly TadE/G-like protein